MSTIQLDFLAKERFKLTYIDQEGKENGDVFVIHRAPLSTHERFMAFLIEHYAGNFPLWLSPVQVRFASVSDSHSKTCEKLASEFKAAGLRADVDANAETIGNKIRKSAHEKIPYTLVVGEKEEQSGEFQVRIRGEQKTASMKKDAFITRLQEMKEKRTPDLSL